MNTINTINTINTEQLCKEIANKWKDQIDPRVYKSLMNYEVHIDD